MNGSVSSPNGKITKNAENNYVFTPTEHFSGSTQISFKITDSAPGSPNEIIVEKFLKVLAVNDAPKITLPIDISSEYLDDRGTDLINAFFIDDLNVYGSSRSSLSGLITKAGGVALTGDDAVSFVSATIEKPNTLRSDGAPATVTETKMVVGDIGGLTFDSVKKPGHLMQLITTTQA